MAERELAQVLASRYWREADARAVVAAWRRSGLTAAEFGRRHGVGARRLSRWATATEGEERERPLAFVELAVGSRSRATSAALEVAVGEAVVRVQPGFDAAHLAAVVRVLRGVSC